MTDNARPTLNIDVAEFEHYLAECEGTDAEKREYLQLIWEIMCEFALLGYGISSVQQVQNNNNCGKQAHLACAATQADSDQLDSTIAERFIKNTTNTTKESLDA